MKPIVYLLWHMHETPAGEEDNKLIGVYSSPEAAEQARQRKIAFPGFRQLPDGFVVDPYTVDEDAWSEGFVTMVGDRQVWPEEPGPSPDANALSDEPHRQKSTP